MPNFKRLMACEVKEQPICVWGKLLYFLIVVLSLSTGCESSYYAEQRDMKEKLAAVKIPAEWNRDKDRRTLEQAIKDQADFKAFQEKAKAWRALSVKPALPEQANRFRVQAEDAFRNKEMDKTADRYEKALEVYPLWPQGQFNASLIYGELGAYHQAINHMLRYLELAPHAKDAKAAREKIYIWEGKVDD